MQFRTAYKGEITAVADLEPHDINTSIYCGHFTVAALKEFIQIAEKRFGATSLAELRTIFIHGDNCYRLALTPDGKTESVIVQGCEHGVDGTS